MITYGPVPSRRLGKSLGINNIMSPKTCSYNCIYCQVGKTLRKSAKRKTFYEPETIYEEVVRHIEKLDSGNHPDYLTFVSNGEPTLDMNLGKAIRLLKKTGIPVAVITNSSMISDEIVREDLSAADWVSLKVDAGDIITWYLINRPTVGIGFEETVSSMYFFSKMYRGRLFTETMLVKGINDQEDNLNRLAGIINTIKPEKAYLAVPTRPPYEKTVRPADPEKLNQAWQIFAGEKITAEFLTGFEGTATGYTGNAYEDILNITAVHPLREDSLRKLLENDGSQFSVVDSLIKQHLIKPVIYESNRYYIRQYHII